MKKISLILALVLISSSTFAASPNISIANGKAVTIISPAITDTDTLAVALTKQQNRLTQLNSQITSIQTLIATTNANIVALNAAIAGH